jgi:hypothetical protein
VVELRVRLAAGVGERRLAGGELVDDGREVDELRRGAVGDRVGRLDVKVQDALGVQEAQGAAELDPATATSRAAGRRRAARCSSVSPPSVSRTTVGRGAPWTSWVRTRFGC